MRVQEKIFLLTLFLAGFFIYAGLKDWFNLKKLSSLISIDQSQVQGCPVIENLNLRKTNNKGNDDGLGGNNVLIVNPKSQDLDFKVNIGVTINFMLKMIKVNFDKNI
jgi:hypothetical protein